MKASIAAAVLAALAAEGATTGRKHSSTRETRAPKPGGTSFTLNQIKNKDFTGRDGAMALMRAHMKYAQKLPDAVAKAVEINPELRIKFAALSQGRR